MSNEMLNTVEEQPTQDLENALEEKAVDEATSEQEKESSPDVEWNKKFAALTRRDKELREKEAEIDKRMAEFESRLEAMNKVEEPEVKEKPELPLEYRLKKDPLGTLRELGYDYEQLTELALNDGKLPADMQLQLMREEIKKEMEEKYGILEQKLTEKEKAEEEAKYKATIDGFKNEIDDFVSKDPEKYELIQANKAQDLIYEMIEAHHQDTGRILEIEEAANALEEYLYEEAQKLLKLKKLSQGKEALNAKEPGEKRHSSTTLSNAHAAQAVNESERKLSREESLANAAKLIQWEGDY